MTEEQSKQGEFNEAFHKINRINELQFVLNKVRMYLFRKMMPDNMYGYEIMASCLDGLYQEAQTEMTADERKQSLSLRNMVASAINGMSIRKDAYGNITSICSKEESIALQKSLFDFETDLRQKLSKHGLGIPSKKDVSKSIVN